MDERTAYKEVSRLPRTNVAAPPVTTPPSYQRNGHHNSSPGGPSGLPHNPSPSGSPQIARHVAEGSPRGSPRVARRQESGSALSSTSRAHHHARIICNSLWGQRLTFHSYSNGEEPVPFCSLWPERKTFVEIYRDAQLYEQPYDLCKLLLASNSHKALDVLLDEQVLSPDCDFGGGCGTLLHLACALAVSQAINSLVRRTQTNPKMWATKDAEGHIPEEVCVRAELRKLLPSHSLFTRNKVPTQGHTLRPENRAEIFELATKPDSFYCLINLLNSFPAFDVNSERNSEGELLIHVAIRGGLPQLPLLFALVNCYKADIRLRDNSGTTPLALAVKLGEETLAEVLVCVFGLNVNESSTPDQLSPLHVAVSFSRPRLLTMLLRRGADALKEDKNGCVPPFLARKQRSLECRQIISQHLRERTERFCQDTIAGTLQVKQLYPSDLCAVSSCGCTLLMLAAMHNQESLVRELLKKGECPLDFRQMKSCDLVDSLNESLEASWKETDKDKDNTLKTAVHYAAERGNLGCLQALLEVNAHPSLQDGSGWLPLHYAVDRGHIECVKAILAYPNHLGLTGLKPALDISRGNDFSEITTVLQAAHERRQQELIMPLLFEAAHSGDKDLIFHVLQNGDQVNPLNEAYDWPLLLAAGFGYQELVAQLHQFGGHVTKRHKISRSTPLHVAARGGHTKVVRYLLQFCRRQSGKTGYSATPLPSGMMEDEEAQFIDINGKNTAGATPLELAASQGHTEVVKLLLENGASTTLPDSNGRLLSCTSFAGTQFLLETHRKERRRFLMESLRSRSRLKQFSQCWQGPSDFNLYASNGDNVLMVAAQYAVPEVLQFLLDQAAAVKPGTLMSSEKESLVLSSLSSSRESSDTSLPTHSRNMSDSNILSSQSLGLRQYDPDMGEPERHTALPSVFRTPPQHPRDREQRLTASGGVGSDRPPTKPPRVRERAYQSGAAGRRSSATTSASSEEDEPGSKFIMNCAQNGEGEEEEGELPEPFISLIRYSNPRDGQTVLHRASAACQHLNVGLLLRRDSELANLRDKEGNTALHLACQTCAKTQKQTVQALLRLQQLP